MELSRRSFIKKAGAVPLIGAVGAVTGALVTKTASASPMVINLADNANGAWADATSWAPGFEPYWAVINPFNQRGWYNGSCWASNVTPTETNPQSLTVHLGGGLPNISKVCIYSVQNNYTSPNPNPPDVTAGTYPHANYFAIKNFTVEAFDGLSWHIVANVTNNEYAKLVIDFVTPVRTNQFRIQVTETQPYTQLALIAGFEAWGTTDYVDLTNKYNVIATTSYGSSGMLQQYDSLSAANAAASAQAAYAALVYQQQPPTINVVQSSRPRMIDTNFRAQTYWDEVFGGGGGGDAGGAVYGFDFHVSSGYSNYDYIPVRDALTQIERDQVDYQMRLAIMGGALAALTGTFLAIPALIGFGAAVSGLGVIGYGRDTNFGGTDPTIVPNAFGGFGIYQRFEPNN